jgi:hypothetical protein
MLSKEMFPSLMGALSIFWKGKREFKRGKHVHEGKDVGECVCTLHKSMRLVEEGSMRGSREVPRINQW